MTAPDVIASRRLDLDGRAFEVLIDRPQPTDQGDYVCSWSLVDDAGMTVCSIDIHGVDSAQALIFATLIIGDRVEAESSQFTHFGLEGTGFPRHFEWDKINVDAPS